MRRETGSFQNLGFLKWIIPELRVLALTKRHVGSGNEIVEHSLAFQQLFFIQILFF